jgi:hypothetical protein
MCPWLINGKESCLVCRLALENNNNYNYNKQTMNENKASLTSTYATKKGEQSLDDPFPFAKPHYHEQHGGITPENIHKNNK